MARSVQITTTKNNILQRKTRFHDDHSFTGSRDADVGQWIRSILNLLLSARRMVFHCMSTTNIFDTVELSSANGQTSISIDTNPISSSLENHQLITRSNRREQFIQTKLLALNSFEFYTKQKKAKTIVCWKKWFETGDQRSPVKPLSSVIDLFKVTKLSLDSGYHCRLDRIRYDRLIDLFKQTPNIHSFTLDPSQLIVSQRLSVDDIYSAFIPYLDRSKLRHGDILVVDLRQVQMLLETFKNLISIRFRLGTDWISFEELSAYVKTLMSRCSTSHDFSSVSIGMDKTLLNWVDSIRIECVMFSMRW